MVAPRSIPRKHNLNSLSGVETYLNLVFNIFTNDYNFDFNKINPIDLLKKLNIDISIALPKMVLGTELHVHKEVMKIIAPHCVNIWNLLVNTNNVTNHLSIYRKAFMEMQKLNKRVAILYHIENKKKIGSSMAPENRKSRREI